LSFKAANGKSLQSLIAQWSNDGTFKCADLKEPTDKQKADLFELCKRFDQTLYDCISSSRFDDANVVAKTKLLGPSIWPDNEIDRIHFGDRAVAEFNLIYRPRI